MNIRLLPGARPLSPESRAGIGAALVLLAIISAAEIWPTAPQPHFIGLFAAAPFLTAAFAAWPEVVAVGALATVIGVVFGMHPHGMTEAERHQHHRDRAGHRDRGRGRHAARPPGGARRRAVPAGQRRPGGGAVAARSAGRAAGGRRPLHLGQRGGRHRRRPLRGARHVVRRPDDHRRRARQGPRRGPAGQHRARLVPARRVRARRSAHDRRPISIGRWPARSATRTS